MATPSVSRQLLWFLLTLSGAPLYADQLASPTVTLVNGDDHSWQSHYTIYDKDLKTEVTSFSWDSYTRIYIPQERHLEIRRKSTDPIIGLTIVVGKKDFTVTSDMAGRVFVLTSSRDWKTWGTIAVNEQPADISTLLFCPDVTGSRLPGVVLGPYEQTFDLLLFHPDQWASIAEAAQPLEPVQKNSLYGRFKLDDGLVFGNVFPGLGVGSFRERDWLGGGVILVSEGATAAAALGFSLGTVVAAAVYPSQGGPDRGRDLIWWSQHATLWAAAYCLVKIASVGRAAWYLDNNNRQLATALDVQRP